MSGDVTDHFSRHEFGLSDKKASKYGLPGADYPADWVKARLLPLCQVLEKVRTACFDHPVTIVSGYRTVEYDTARIAAGNEGVSPRSQHHEGRAADIQIEGCTPEQVEAAVMHLYDVGDIQIGGLGVYDDFVHIDVRGGALKRWDFRSHKP